MAKSKSSKIWLQEHRNDIYVRRAKEEGYRARSVYKLKEIEKQYRFIKSGMKVVELGAAPGGWSEFIAEIIGERGKILAIDILPIAPISNVKFLRGDFTDPIFVEKVRQEFKSEKVDLVLSDMAPNISGIKEVDEAKALELVEAAFTFAVQTLKSGGTFLVKIFQGADFMELVKKIREHFQVVKIIKPLASRSRSSEIFLLAKNFNSI